MNLYGRCTISSGYVNVRASMTIYYQTVYTLAKDEIVTILDSDRGGYFLINHILYGNGYVTWDEVTPINGAASFGYVSLSSGNLNVRTGPNTSFPVAATLPNGTGVYCITTSNGWTLVDGMSVSHAGWCQSTYISATPPFGPNYGITLDQVRSGYSMLRYDIQTVSDAVRTVQTLLRQWGQNCAVDGIYGNETVTAVTNFQISQGLYVGGVVGRDVLLALEANGPNYGVTLAMVRAGTAVLRFDLRTQGSNAVRELQQLLANAGYPCGSDGTYGNIVSTAVGNFQGSKWLPIDGICNMNTLAQLESSGGPNAGITIEQIRAGIKVLKLDLMTTGSPAVIYIQERLRNNFYLGLDDLVVDGCYGPATERAVREFQSMRSEMIEDGVVGQNTLYWLELSNFIGPNRNISISAVAADQAELRFDTISEEASVREVQTKLNAIGYSVGAVDGKFGRRTREAVTSFQNARGLLSVPYNAPMSIAAHAASALNFPTIAGRVNQATLAAVNSSGSGGDGDNPGHNATLTLTSVKNNPGLMFKKDIGTYNPAVAKILWLLKQINPSSVSSIDGMYGPEAFNAVKSFQQSRGLPATGNADGGTIIALERSVRTSNNGSYASLAQITAGHSLKYDPHTESQAVRQLKDKLNALGLYAGASSCFDELCLYSVLQAQYALGITPSAIDGRVGQDTISLLNGATSLVPINALQWKSNGVVSIQREVLEKLGFTNTDVLNKASNSSTGLSAMMNQYSINTKLQASVFLGQGYCECGSSGFIEAAGSGNHRGAGFIQLTHESNYRKFGRHLDGKSYYDNSSGVGSNEAAVVSGGYQLIADSYPFRSGAWYYTERPVSNTNSLTMKQWVDYYNARDMSIEEVVDNATFQVKGSFQGGADIDKRLVACMKAYALLQA